MLYCFLYKYVDQEDVSLGENITTINTSAFRIQIWFLI